MTTIIIAGFTCVVIGILLAFASAAGWWTDETDQEYEDNLMLRHLERQNGKKRRK